jgi:hypothetical protein
MKKTLLILFIIFGLGTTIHAQDFSFGAGLGFFNQNSNAGLNLSLPMNFRLMRLSDININLRAEIGIVFSQKPALTALISPMVSYILAPLDFLPITVYAGATVRLFIQDVLEDSRAYYWSFLGGVAGISVSITGFIGIFIETSLSMVGDTPMFSVQTGLRF